LAARIALTIASPKFSPGLTSRLAIQQASPFASRAAQIRLATLLSY
jgi:hypothetical protein